MNGRLSVLEDLDKGEVDSGLYNGLHAEEILAWLPVGPFMSYEHHQVDLNRRILDFTADRLPD